MRRFDATVASLLAAAALALAPGGYAQTAPPPAAPAQTPDAPAQNAPASGVTPAQSSPDLDVPYVTTPQHVVDAMLELARVRSSDFVLDLGSGDGRIVIAAARQKGARGLGV